MSTNWKSTSYDSILLIVGLHDEPVQIPIDAPGLAEVFIPPDSIVSDQDSVSTSKSWSPRYHFLARLRLHAFELIARVSYDEDIIFRFGYHNVE